MPSSESAINHAMRLTVLTHGPILATLLSLCAAGQSPRDLFAAPPTGCPQSPVTPSPGPITADDSVTLQRTSCLGSCPVYTLQIQGNGNVTWTGHAYVAITGQATAQIDPTAARQLIERFRTSGFFSLCRFYPIGITDVPGVRLTASIAGQQLDVYSEASTAPSFIHELVLAIDRTANVHQFLHGDPTTEPIHNLPSETNSKPGWTPLLEATRAHSTAPLEELLRTKPDHNASDPSG